MMCIKGMRATKMMMKWKGTTMTIDTTMMTTSMTIMKSLENMTMNMRAAIRISATITMTKTMNIVMRAQKRTTAGKAMIYQKTIDVKVAEDMDVTDHRVVVDIAIMVSVIITIIICTIITEAATHIITIIVKDVVIITTTMGLPIITADTDRHIITDATTKVTGTNITGSIL